MPDQGRTDAQGPSAFPPQVPPPYPTMPTRAGSPPAYPGEAAPPLYPGEDPPTYPGEVTPPPYPDSVTPPPYPGDGPPAYPGEAAPPAYPAEGTTASASHPVDAPPGGGPVAEAQAAPPGYPGNPPPPPQPPANPPKSYAGPPYTTPEAPIPPLPPFPPAGAVDHDDLALQSGRKHLKAHQRGVDGAALSQLVMTLPIALISLSVVTFAFSLVNPGLALIMAIAWLLSGPLVFNRSVEAAIAQRLLGMRQPTPEEAARLWTVWEEVTRRAGVGQGTYVLWVQERAELNATAAAGHIVAVTRHAMDRLPNSQLAAILAHELGHHVGGHTWAAMLADWYALPARTVGRWIFVGLTGLLKSRNVAGVACGGCLSLVILQFLYVLTFEESMWWLVLPITAAPLLIAWLHRRAEHRADDYAAGLGFGIQLMSVLAAEHQTRTALGTPLAGAAPPGRHPAVKSAHTNFEARLQHLQRNATDQSRPPAGRP